ncbi:dTDP-4-dehydrorhamnose reductase [Sphingomonas sp. AX6]|uniref:dTDP-4-dehydrorhamnose reductase n=1 Tax=Sphingomonas sp. AX6 TaxID=2653171 RepID=UPI0012F1BCAA|nr:dTDP-4-dehydrorhamnose reductase [Sphingomonas sp. AX6]VXC98885.1 dTDP-4-dehydrorhamnose reductase [Sphingomonas sp. AX6]
MPKSRTILVTGANGQLGRELQRIEWPNCWQIHPVDRSAVDLSDPDAIAALVGNHPCSVVINAAAYTAVDAAETDPVAAWTVNALAPAALAAACARAGIPLVQASTDYVFSGERTGDRLENDPVDPINVYGASKLGGELAVRTSGARHVILRTSWLYSASGRNFVTAMLRMAVEQKIVRVVDDQRGNPTSASELAVAISDVAMRLVDDPDAPTGIFHFAGSGTVSWADFAAEIFRQSASRGGPFAHVEPIASTQYSRPARRPANSALGLTAIRDAYGINPRRWQESLRQVLDEIMGGNDEGHHSRRRQRHAASSGDTRRQQAVAAGL